MFRKIFYFSLLNLPLLAQELNPNQKLMEAIRANDLQEAKLAVNLGADVNYIDPKDGNFPLGVAATLGHMRLVLFLLNMGAEVNLSKKGGWNALMGAADEGHLKIVQLLVAKGANVNSQTQMGRTVLMRASYHGRDEVVRYLVSKGAKVNAQDNEGTTALMLAAQRGHVETIRTLLKNQAEINIQNNKGKSALDYALDYKREREALGYQDGALVLRVFSESKKVDKSKPNYNKSKIIKKRRK